MLKLLRYLKKREWGLVLVALVFIVAQVFLDLTMPDYMSDITTLINTEGSTIGEIMVAGGKMLACAAGSLLASVVTAICAARIASNFSARVRRELFGKVQDFSMGEIGHFSTASLITRSTNDVTQVQMLIVLGLQMLIKAPITAVWAVLKILNKQWEWTFATGTAVVVLFIIVIIVLVVAMPKFRKLQQLTDEVNRVTRENLNGLRVVRAYNAEEYQEDKFEKANQELTSTNLFTQRTMAFLMPSIQLVMSGLSLSIYWIGAVLIHEANMSGKISLFSDMMVFSQYAVQVVMAFMMLIMIFMLLPRAQVAANRINEVLDTPLSIVDGADDPAIEKTQKEHQGEIAFKNVSFKYPDAEECVIENIDFEAKKGQTVAIIGSTGCGKSTVANLIPRFYDVTESAVLVDGVDVREYSQEALRNKIGYISQKAVLFTGDIRTNVGYGDNGKQKASDEEIMEAIEAAQAGDFIASEERGLDAAVAQGGTNFSGGQKQRLSIARAIARKPEILIFDDSFSALDYKTDRVLRKTLDEKLADTTRIIVAQRIGTIRDADQIIVLDEGRIAGKGTHDELMKNCEVYQEIALSQLSKEELA